MHALDLRDIVALERFCSFLTATQSRLDIIVNNACQTVRRPAAYYAHLMQREAALDRALEPGGSQLRLGGERCGGDESGGVGDGVAGDGGDDGGEGGGEGERSKAALSADAASEQMQHSMVQEHARFRHWGVGAVGVASAGHAECR